MLSKITIPLRIKELADDFKKKRLERKMTSKDREIKRKLEERNLSKKRFKKGLSYVEKIFK